MKVWRALKDNIKEIQADPRVVREQIEAGVILGFCLCVGGVIILISFLVFAIS